MFLDGNGSASRLAGSDHRSGEGQERHPLKGSAAACSASLGTRFRQNTSISSNQQPAVIKEKARSHSEFKGIHVKTIRCFWNTYQVRKVLHYFNSFSFAIN